MGGSSTHTTSTTNQNQTNAPPAFTFPGLQQAGSMTLNALNSLPTSHYTGPLVASMNPQDLAAIQQAWGQTAANAGGAADYLTSLLPQLTAGQNFSTALPNTSYNVADRPDLTSVIQASIHPVQQQLMEQILPGITNSALQSGAYSNDRAMGVMPQTAIRDATDSMQRIAAQLGYQDYNDYENRRLAAYQATTQAGQQNYALDTARQQELAGLNLQALGMAPDFVQSILHTQASQGDLLRMAAELGVQQQQAGYNNAQQMDQYASTAPFLGLDAASSILARLSGNYGTQTMHGTTDQTQTTQQDPMGQLLQAGLGLGMAAMGMPGGLGGIFGGGGATAALGGGAGAASLFSAPPAMAPVNPYFQQSPSTLFNWGGH